MKKILISIGLFIIGIAISSFAEDQLRYLIQTLFKILTNNAIRFYGKDFYFFGSPYYYVSFGLSFPVTWYSWSGLTTRQKVTGLLLTFVIFFIAIIGISWAISNMMIVECTACKDGTRQIRYNDVNYDGIILGGLFLSLVPAGMRLIRRWVLPIRKKKHHQSRGSY